MKVKVPNHSLGDTCIHCCNFPVILIHCYYLWTYVC